MKRFTVIFLLLILITSFFTLFSYAYENYCWNDGTPISSNYNDKCPVCGWYVCTTCNACSVGNFHCVTSYDYDDGTPVAITKKENSMLNFIGIGGFIIFILICIFAKPLKSD